ncbi:MAG TPA: EamA family transporter [Gemmatimonadales bacterium]|jgi:drug/metabolite transporter (DMT)-like permease|nr:EamA family transporter [Gemmatimonadales bacterium]
MRAITKYDLEMLIVSLIWGGNFSASKLAMEQFSPLAFSGLRFTLAAVLLVLIAIRARVLAPLPRRTFWGLAGLGVLGNTLYQTAFMTGLSLTTATNSAMIVASLPVLVALLASLLGIERASPTMWLGVVLGTGGVALVVTARGVHFDAASFHGDLLVLFAIFCWAGYTVGVRRIGAGVDALQITVITTVAGTPGLLLLGAPGLVRQEWSNVSGKTWGVLAYAALLALVLCYVLYNRAVQGIGTARTAIYNCLVPLVAMLIAWFTLGETLTGIQLLGVALVIGGVLVSIATKRAVPEPVVVPE